ncbi:DNA polymerase III subunit gamma and tau [Bowdeniella nasicola]|uniref:DNA polymerase III subunit gamma and tau n=1 Tax=Bowdeniella nasicola TaxID=208480 RepID=UPI000AA0E3F6|nr:DNA polymerase III subunit gamma and tau [Bowdeniella nasicola]
MSTALYRRYRPETFAEVIGQEHVTEPLTAALRADRISHAYLFSGPRGCGKTTSARIFARCLNCAEGPTDTPCGTCPSCVDLARGGSGSLDVVEIDAASHNGVDDARDLRERAAFAPARDRFKIFILDEAHMVTPQGFNALLKIVEEPPAHVKFIFATTEPEKVIGTIRSRTHHYPFRLVPPEQLSAYLNHLCEAESIQIDKGVVPLVVRAGGGSVRDSLSVLDQLMAGAIDGEIGYERAAQLLGYTSAGLLDDAVGAMSGIDGAALFRVVDHVVESGHDPKRFTEDLLQRLRDLVVLAIAGDAGRDAIHGVPDDQLERMAHQASQLGARRASVSADAVHDALIDMSGATSPRLQLELLCARLILAQTQPEAPAAGAVPAQGSVPAERMPRPADRPLPQMPKFGRASGQEQQPNAPQRPEPAPAASKPEPAREERAQQVPEPERKEQPEPAPEAQREPMQAPAPEAQREPKQAPAPAEAERGASAEDADMLRRRWDEVLEVLKGISRVTWTLVQDHAVVGAVSGDSVPVLFQIDPLRQRFENGPHAEHLAEAIFQAVGLRVTVHGEQVGANDAAPVTPAKKEPQPAPEPSPSPQPAPQRPEPVRQEPQRPEPVRQEPQRPEPAPEQQEEPATGYWPAPRKPGVPMPADAPAPAKSEKPAPGVPMPGVPFPSDHVDERGRETNTAQPELKRPDVASPLTGSATPQAEAHTDGPEPSEPPDDEDEYGGASDDDQVVDDAESELSGVQLLKAELGGVVLEEIDET